MPVKNLLLVFGFWLLVFSGCPNKPPKLPSKPTGPTNGPQYQVMTFQAVTTDPNGDDIAYQFDFGDGKRSNWSNFLPSGTAFSDTHTFVDTGTFSVRVRAKDTKGATSPFSPALSFFVTTGVGSVKWKVVCLDIEGDTLSFVSHPAIGDNGIIYAACSEGELHGIDTNGNKLYTFRHPEEGSVFYSAPVIGEDGTVYITSDDGIYALEPNLNLKLKWKYPRVPLSISISSTPAIGFNNYLYFLSEDSTFCLKPSGEEVWSDIGGGDASPAINPAGEVFIATNSGWVRKVDPYGNPKWSYYLAPDIISSPALDPLDRVYIGVGNTLQLLKEGSGLWSKDLEGEVDATPVIDENGVVFIGSKSGKFFAFNSDGSKKWEFSTGATNFSTGAVAAQGVVYVRANFDETDTLYALRTTDGTRLFARPIPTAESEVVDIPSPNLGKDGTIYLSGGDGLYALIGGAGGAANSSWPLFRANEKNTGRRK